MPATTKQKYSSLMSGFEDKLKKLKKSFTDLRTSKNKTNHNYEDVLDLNIFRQLKIYFNRMTQESH